MSEQITKLGPTSNWPMLAKGQSPQSGSPGHRWSWLAMLAGFPWIGLMIFGLLVFAVIDGSTRRVGGRGYFSPDTLQSRFQVEFPLVWGDFAYYRSELVEYLIEKGHWSPQQVAKPRWIWMFHWNYRWHGGYSRLDKELHWKRGWIEWSEANPALAKVVWPSVLSLLREEGDDGSSRAVVMLDVARSAKDVAEFERKLAAEGLRR